MNCNEIFTETHVITQADWDQLKSMAHAHTQRRLDAEGGVNLSQRRNWFVDPPTPPAPADPVVPPADDPPDSHGDWFKSLPPEAQREIETLRGENANTRKKLRDQEEANRKADEKRLTDAQEWQKLAEQRAARLAELEPLQGKLSAIEEQTKTTNEKRIAAIPADLRGLVPSGYDPLTLRDWLDANQSVFTSRRAPEMGAGASGDGGGTGKGSKLTPEQIALARSMGLNEKDVLANLKQHGQA